MHSTTDHPLPSERSFGFLFAAVFAISAAYGVYKGQSSLTVLVLAAACIVLLLVTLVQPAFLVPLNRAWFKLGMLLGMVVSPLVVGLLFFLLITPISLVTRFFGRDVLRLRHGAEGSYWIDRVPPGPASESFKNQF